MYKKIVSLVIVSLFVTGCSNTQPTPPKGSEKIYAQEDAYILYALRAEQVRNYEVASKLFFQLYEKAPKKEYLYRSLEDAIVAKKYDDVLEKIDTLDQDRNDDKLQRIKILALAQKKEYAQALKLSKELVHKTQLAQDYVLVGDILIKQKKYDLALKYYESGYTKNYDEKILDKMAILLYVNLHRKKDAIALLETHTRIHGCSQIACHRLLGIYANENNVDGLLSVYKRLYALKKDDNIAKKIVQLYGYKREYIPMMEFLEENGVDDPLLLELYVTAKNYKKATLLAQKLYEQSGDINYLGQSAVYEYEAYHKNISRKRLDEIVTKLTQVVEQTDKNIYRNYLGYMLIDHELDVKKGIAYIKKVLKTQPDSPYYIDSLAWGYYKLGACKKAAKLMKKVVQLGEGDEPEVAHHLQEIEKCVQNPNYKKVIIKR
jgi:predicted Zn-dependent protease